MLMIKAHMVLLRSRVLEPFSLAWAIARHPSLGVNSHLSLLESKALQKFAWLL